ncbi:MAG: riboflavin synthase [Alphaproteobacteria bacterium]|nr:riboflavin synthase [Alphaproteobacteria bacterium]
MFTGLIQDTGVIARVEKQGTGAAQSLRARIETGMNLERIAMGASVSCSGCCLTVVAKVPGAFEVELSAETLARTVPGQWEQGSRINLEPSLRLGDEMGGHFVFGHVDGVARIESIERAGDFYRIILRAPEELTKFIAPKGSISLDGVSLTVNEVEGGMFGVTIIPHTWAHTTLHLKKPGDGLNLEADMLARYVARMIPGGNT